MKMTNKELFTIGFTQKTAERFFSLISKANIQLLVDVRLNNKSQLAGFTRGTDLEFFLKKLCNCHYKHSIEYAPDKSLLQAYKNNKTPISWSEYTDRYTSIIIKRNALEKFKEILDSADRICLLCSEPRPENCHRGILASMLAERYQIKVTHLL